MEENKHEILKRKKIRKLLLLKINDELKEISKYKSNIRINSKTIQEINKLYNRSNILLFEKSTIYSNYIKTGETIISRNISPINIVKTLNIDNNYNNNINKIKSKNNKKEEVKISHIEVIPHEDDSVSPIICFVPQKIELGRKKLFGNKNKRINGSVPNIPDKIINSQKEALNQNKLNKSTKIGGDSNLHKLIEKITFIKNNENNEGIILKNIKKLRNYCYQLRKKRKKIKKLSAKKSINYIKKTKSKSMPKFKEKEKDKEKEKEKDKKIVRNLFKKRNTITLKDQEIFKNSFFLDLQKKMEDKLNKSNSKKKISPTLSPSFKFNINIKKKSTAKFEKRNNNLRLRHRPSNKSNLKNYFSIKSKDEAQKLQILKENIGSKIINKLNKKKNKKSVVTTDSNLEDFIPNLSQIPKEIMRSSVNQTKIKFENEEEKSKPKYIKTKFYKKNNLKKNGSSQKILIKENDKGYKYFSNINSKNYKKDKIELHERLIHNKSNKKIKKYEFSKKENEENNEEIIKLKKLSIVLDTRKKSKKKLIDSLDRKVYRHSNFTNYNTYMTTNTSNQIANDKNERTNESIIKKNKKV